MNNKVTKALYNRASSGKDTPSWREPLARESRRGFLEGFMGSWAASHALVGVGHAEGSGNSPTPIIRSENRLGHAGAPEINFRPYDWGTNRSGKYGPSLLGHPISFEVVGPTFRNITLAQASDASLGWVFQEDGGTQTLENDLTTIEDLYGISALPEEGLYLVVTQTGSEGLVESGGVYVTGGLGDGYTTDAMKPKTKDSRYEVFRVVSVSGKKIQLDSSKRFLDYFEASGGVQDKIAGIMLIKPAATRVIEVPNSKGTVFAIVPPERSLSGDTLFESAVWEGSDTANQWIKNTLGIKGNLDDYGDKMALPVGVPYGHGVADIDESSPTGELGRFWISVDSNSEHLPDATTDVGSLVKIYDVEMLNGAELVTSMDNGSLNTGIGTDRLLGFYEIVDIDSNRICLRGISQIDPHYGTSFYPDLPFLTLKSKANGERMRIRWAIHKPISSLWKTPSLSTSDLEASRIMALIDPSWVGANVKGKSGLFFSNRHKPDRVTFRTESGDPGSLLDLGFRAVLYPAKKSVLGDYLVPDFDNPVSTNEIRRSGDSFDRHSYEIDYESGMIYFDTPPEEGGSILLTEDFKQSPSDNPRKERTFFISCMPMSRESFGDLRVTASRGDGYSYDAHYQESVFGSRTAWQVVRGQALDFGDLNELRILGGPQTHEIPSKGFFELRVGESPEESEPLIKDAQGQSQSVFGYLGVSSRPPRLTGVYGGGESGSPTYTIPPPYADPLVVGGRKKIWAVLRQNVVSPLGGEGFLMETPYAYDTTQGWGKSVSEIRFKHAEISHEVDGSLTVQVKLPETREHTEVLGHVFTNSVLDYNLQTDKNFDLVTYTLLKILVNGRVQSIEGVGVRFSDLPVTQGYLYIDCSSPGKPEVRVKGLTPQSAPLPRPGDILLGRFHYRGIQDYDFIDLAYPLQEVNKRSAVYVGGYYGHSQPQNSEKGPHFRTLVEALEYVSEVYDPESRIGAGSVQIPKGQAFVIKVVGDTEETSESVYEIKCSNITIEGVGNPTIGWKHASTPLFDIAGCDNLKVSGLTFTHTSGDTNNPLYVFRCKDSDLTGVTIHDCYVQEGNSQTVMGLLQVDAEGYSFTNSTVSHCKATNIKHFVDVLCDDVEHVDLSHNYLSDAPLNTSIKIQAERFRDVTIRHNKGDLVNLEVVGDSGEEEDNEIRIQGNRFNEVVLRFLNLVVEGNRFGKYLTEESTIRSSNNVYEKVDGPARGEYVNDDFRGGYLNSSVTVAANTKYTNCTFNTSAYSIGERTDNLSFINCKFNHPIQVQGKGLTLDSCQINIKANPQHAVTMSLLFVRVPESYSTTRFTNNTINIEDNGGLGRGSFVVEALGGVTNSLLVFNGNTVGALDFFLDSSYNHQDLIIHANSFFEGKWNANVGSPLELNSLSMSGNLFKGPFCYPGRTIRVRNGVFKGNIFEYRKGNIAGNNDLGLVSISTQDSDSYAVIEGNIFSEGLSLGGENLVVSGNIVAERALDSSIVTESVVLGNVLPAPVALDPARPNRGRLEIRDSNVIIGNSARTISNSQGGASSRVIVGNRTGKIDVMVPPSGDVVDLNAEKL